MYKVFVNDRPIILTNEITRETNHKLYLLDTAPVEEVIRQMYSGALEEVHFCDADKEHLLSKFQEKLPLVIAGGGLVLNKNKETLFILRNGKWDLPKGKLDKGETIEEASKREVEEETGVSGLRIEKFLQTTYHVFKRNGTFKLKETHWYLMRSKYKGPLVPQQNEGIKEVRWMNSKEAAKALKNSYENIKELFPVL